jgi:hypothetical protein
LIASANQLPRQLLFINLEAKLDSVAAGLAEFATRINKKRVTDVTL